MPDITPEIIRAARDAFKKKAGITIYLPDEGTLDDFEQVRYDGLCAAITAALSAQPVDPDREFRPDINYNCPCTHPSQCNGSCFTPPAPASSEPVDGRCPRPCNGRPDDFSMRACIEAGECGCIAFPPAPTGDGWPVPEGWQLVPTKTDYGMIERRYDTRDWEGEDYRRVQEDWAKWLAAAPTPEGDR